MEKWKFKEVVTEYEDAVITYRSTNSKNLKYNVCTLNFNNKYLQSKRIEQKKQMILFYYFVGILTHIDF